MHLSKHNEVVSIVKLPSPEEMMNIRGKQALNKLNLRRTKAEEAGVPALYRLVAVALGDSGQSRICANFLLSLHDSASFPFKLYELRNLDMCIWEDCMLVLKLDQSPKKEIHCMVENGHSIWEELKAIWGARLLLKI